MQDVEVNKNSNMRVVFMYTSWEQMVWENIIYLCISYSRMLSVSPTTKSRNLGSLVNNKQDTTWKEVVKAYFLVPLRNLPIGTE
jgi:hypothetical protein